MVLLLTSRPTRLLITLVFLCGIMGFTATGTAFAAGKPPRKPPVHKQVKVTPTKTRSVKPSAASNTAVLTSKYDTMRTGQTPNETSLTTSNVNTSQFGKHVAYPVDGYVYAQPLYMPNLTINGVSHNVVFVATENDSVYAFDADQNGAPSAPLWHTGFLINGATTVSSADVSCNDIVPQQGITSTPVIDSGTGTMYVIANTKENGKIVYKIHALNIATGQDRPGSPTLIQASVPGTGAGSSNGRVSFDGGHALNRPGLLLLNGVVYSGWSSHCDNAPYHGWVLGYSYSGSAFQQVSVYNASANGAQVGIWESGQGLAADSSGNIYIMTGNGDYDLDRGGSSAGDSFIKLSTQNNQLRLVDYFTPFNQSCLSAVDSDLGSGGPLLLPSSNEMIGVGKEGRVYVVSRGSLGHHATISNTCSNQGRTDVDPIVQELPQNTIVGGAWTSPSYWNGPNGEYVYFAGSLDHVRAYKLTNGLLGRSPASTSPDTFHFPGGDLTISSNGTTPGTGVAWVIDPNGVLRAYDATDVSKEIYNSSQLMSRDAPGSYVKFSVPTVANGEVFVGTQHSLVIYGLLSSQQVNGYNNVGISDDGSPQSANYDNQGFSYSAQLLQSAGLTPGQQVNFNGANFTWPNVSAGSLDNWQASGQTIPVTPVSGATTLAFLGSSTNGSASGTATITYTDGSTQTFTLGLTDWGVGTPAFGNGIVTSMPYRNGSAGRQTLSIYLYYAGVMLQSGKTVQSVTLPSTVSGGQLHVFAIGTKSATSSASYNNVGISDDSHPGGANFDGGACSYSTQALQVAGLNQGGSVTFNNAVFTWPNVAPGTADNYQAQGQTIAVNPANGATTLILVGAANNGPSIGAATIGYSDGSLQSFQLGFSDWTLNAGKVGPSYGNGVVATMAYRNCGNTQNIIKTYVFYTEVTLQSGKTAQNVTLPSLTNQGRLHVFAVGTRGSAALPAYNNTGISNDNAANSANYDGGAKSYSAQALQGAGVMPNRAVAYNNVVFTWPNAAPGSADNWQANGQTIPVTPVNGATTLAFLGSSTNGSASGTATITYSDGSTQTFTLGFTDWAVGAPAFGNGIVATTFYRNCPCGKQTLHVFLFYAGVALQGGKTLQSVTLPSTVSGGQLHVFAIATKGNAPSASYNNTGISDDGAPGSGNFDGGVCSYSAQTLQGNGFTPGHQVSVNNVNFTWPNAASGTPDNYVTQGQPVQVTPVNGATTLAFLGSASNGPSVGTAAIVYTDGTVQTFALGLSDWTLNAGKTGPSYGNQVAATLTYRNCSGGKNTINTYVFYGEVALLPGKTVQNVILPSAPNQGHIHVFAVGTK